MYIAWAWLRHAIAECSTSEKELSTRLQYIITEICVFAMLFSTLLFGGRTSFFILTFLDMAHLLLCSILFGRAKVRGQV